MFLAGSFGDVVSRILITSDKSTIRMKGSENFLDKKKYILFSELPADNWKMTDFHRLWAPIDPTGLGHLHILLQ